MSKSKKESKKVVILRRFVRGGYHFRTMPEALALRNMDNLKKEGYEIYEEKKAIEANKAENVENIEVTEENIDNSKLNEL